MEKSIYVYGLNRIESKCYFEILEADSGRFIGSGERSGNQLTVARELKAQESRRGDKVNVRLATYGYYDADI
jgi:hypothetical protein